MDKTPLYKYPGSYAGEKEELKTYHASHQANVNCKKAIEAAIIEHYHDNRLSKEAVKEVIGEFGYDRTLYVLAVTVEEKKWDGRFSEDNKRWAQTIPVYKDMNAWNQDQNREFVVEAHSGLTNLFLTEARHEYLLSLPLKKEDIKAEANKILKQFQDAREPNSPEGTHYMAQLSPDFLIRASSKDQGRLIKELGFSSVSLSTLKDIPGVYAFISKDEDRFHPPCRNRASVRDTLKQTNTTRKPSVPGKKNVQER